MTQPTLAPGVYMFYAGHENGRTALYSLYFDGVTMGSPVACSITSMPDLIGAPSAFYDASGSYAGDGLPRIHVFAPVDNNIVWWLSTVDGMTFITHNENLPNVATSHTLAALLLDTTVHLYYTDQATNRVAHAWSETDWTTQSSELLLTANETAGWGVAAIQVPSLYILFSNGQSQPDQPQYNLRAFRLQPGTGSNGGSGEFVDQSPAQGLDIQLYGAPAATFLGDNLIVPYKGTGDGGQQAYYATLQPDGAWTAPQPMPDSQTTNSVGSCLYGGRLFCAFQSSNDNSLYLQVYLGLNWLPNAIQIAGSTPRVFWGPAAVAVERAGSS